MINPPQSRPNWRYTTGPKVVIFWRKGWWQIAHLHPKYGVVCGQGKRPVSAWNDYQRRLKWYAQGCPGCRY